MRSHDHLGSITAFVTTAQCGSFTTAAERLGLTKSAVGKSVARLEERLGLKLLQRSTRRLSLTPDGQRYLQSCQNALEVLDQAEAELSAHTLVPAGRLRIDLPAAFGRRRVLPHLLRLAGECPALTLSVTFSERFVDLIEEGIDLVVRIGELSDSSGLAARRLTTQKLVICAAPTYLEGHGTPLTPQDLERHRCIVGLRRGQPVSWLLREADGRQTRYTPPATHELADGDAMLDAVIAGCGLSQLPLWLVRDDLQRGTLRTVLQAHSGGEIPISAIWPAGGQMPPRTRHVVDALVAVAAQGGLD